MRPRVFPAEDPDTAASGSAGPPRFNEAAGIPRGRRPTPSEPQMHCTSFNEAAGIPRGRLGALPPIDLEALLQ